MHKPLILITNDDGIDAPGLKALIPEIEQLGEIRVVAPIRERSGVSHAITLTRPIRVIPFSHNGTYVGQAVDGNPVDCVKVACWELLDRKPDLVVSGINFGSNTGLNNLYSGTVSAAMEGAILGIPSMAVSLTTYLEPNFGYAAKFARKMGAKLLEEGLPQGTLLSINVPNCDESEIQGVSFTRHGMSPYEEGYLKREDPRHKTYYWLSGQKMKRADGIDVDDGAIAAKMVSVTPLKFDITDHRFLKTMQKWEL